MRRRENLAAKGGERGEEKRPRLATGIRVIVGPHAHADPELKSARRSTNPSAAEVCAALKTGGYAHEDWPSERTMRDILNRMSDRLKRIRKGKPLKKAQETDAITRVSPSREARTGSSIATSPIRARNSSGVGHPGTSWDIGRRSRRVSAELR